MKMFSKQFPIKRTNSHGRTTITTGSNLFCQKSSFHFPKKKTSFKSQTRIFWQNLMFWAPTFLSSGSRKFSMRSMTTFEIFGKVLRHRAIQRTSNDAHTACRSAAYMFYIYVLIYFTAIITSQNNHVQLCKNSWKIEKC